MKYLPLLTAFLITTPIFAETLITPSEFEKLSTGKTLYFTQDGESYGAEQFFKGQRTKWRFSDGNCEKGEWFSHKDMFCFNYEGGLETQCWHFFKTDDNGYAARAEGAPKEEVINLESIDRKPLLCSDEGLSV
jgi:hypothetical protein